MWQRRGDLVKVHRHLAGQHIVDGRACTTVGDVHHGGAGAALEQLAPHVADGAVARGRVRHLAGVGLEVLHQVGKVLDGQRGGVDHDDAWRLHDLGHTDKVLGGVVGQLGVHGGVHAVGRQRGNANGEAVWRCAGHFGHADGAACAAPIFQHHGLLEDAGQRLLQAARRDVGGTPGWEGNNDAQGLALLRQRHSRNERYGSHSGKDVTALHGHFSYEVH
ncbi:hypothetical protein D3C72_1469770 [compost metagenome]